MIMIAAAVVLPFAAVAQAEEGWNVRVGGGVAGSAVYEGSDEYFATPLPVADVSWRRGGFTVSASLLGGVGATYLDEEHGVLVSATVGMGGTRSATEHGVLFVPVEHAPETRELLEGTPDVTGRIAADVTLGYVTPVGLIAATAGYRPTSLDYPAGAAGDEMLHGSVYSLVYMVGLPVTERIGISATAVIEAIDRRYADAWYSLGADTPSLQAFDAQAGLRNAGVALEGTAMLGRRLGVSLMASEAVLLGAAARSPYTRQAFQTTVMLTSFYRVR